MTIAIIAGSSDDLCRLCGERLGQHSFRNDACPIRNPQGKILGFKSTKFVGSSTTVSPSAMTINVTPLPDNWYVTTDYRTMPNCGSCGAPAGEHHINGAQCPDKNDPAKYITGHFYLDPRGNEGLTGMSMPIPSPTHSTASKPSKQYKEDEECPCGLMSAMCDYHKD